MRIRSDDYLLVLGAAGLLLSAGCGSAPAAPAAAAPPPAELTHLTVPSLPSTDLVELPGVVIPERAATLHAPVGGQIRSLAEEGDLIALDASAAVLHTSGLSEQLRAAQAGVDAAERRRAGAETAIRQASSVMAETAAVLEQTLKSVEAERDRRQDLLAEAELQAETEPERLRAHALAAEARVRLLKSGERPQRIRQLQASLEVARAEATVALDQFKRARSLFGQGYVSKREVETAELVLRRARASELQHAEEVRLQTEGAHPEAIAEAEQQAEAARQALKNAGSFKLHVSQRRAELAGAEADVAKAARQLRDTRGNRLAISRAQDEAAASTAEARRSSLGVDEARERLAQTTVRAPFASQVVKRLARPGESVLLGAPLLELVHAGQLAFEATVTDAHMARLRPGALVSVTVTSADISPLPGRVREVIGTSDPLKRTYQVRIELLRQGRLRPGMIGVARLRIAGAHPGVRLPVSVLRRHFPSELRGEVWVLGPAGPIVREVTLAAQGGTHVVITSGLRPGERVVVSDTGLELGTRPIQSREVLEP